MVTEGKAVEVVVTTSATRRDYNAKRGSGGAPGGSTGGGVEKAGVPPPPPLKDQECWILPDSCAPCRVTFLRGLLHVPGDCARG